MYKSNRRRVETFVFSVLLCILSGWVGAQQDIAFHFGEGDDARLARSGTVDIGGIRYIPISSVIEQFGGYVDLAAGRAQISLDGRGAIITINDVQVETASDDFRLRHPLLREGDTAYMALADFERFFRNVFNTRLWIDQITADEPPSPEQGEDVLDDLLAPLAPAPQETGRRRIRSIVLDPGHGGTDSGAVGPNGLEEKEVTLAVAQSLKRILEAEMDVEVVLTREADVELPDRARSNLAGQAQGDLLISIHTGASFVQNARGFEVFYADVPSGDGEGGSDSGVRYAARSRLLATAVSRSLSATEASPNRGVRPTPARVLSRASMPGILVEVGCITNPEEENLLASEGHRNRLAEGIARGIIEYATNTELPAGGAG